MADIGDSDVEYNSGRDSTQYNGPNTPHEAATGVGNTKESYGNAALDEGSAGGIEEFSDEEKLYSIVSFLLPEFLLDAAGVHIPWFRFVSALPITLKTSDRIRTFLNIIYIKLQLRKKLPAGVKTNVA